MTEVVYADILIVVSTYINYALLRLTGMICRKKQPLWRLALSSLAGSFYSFIILADFIPTWVIMISKLAFAAVMILISFKLCGKKDFLRLFTVFFVVNFAFAGIMFAVWISFMPEKMFFNNGIVYFNVNTLTLALLTVLCYAVIKLFAVLASRRTPVNTIYDLEFDLMEKTFSCKAFLDTGNNLKEPFSGFPVIVADESLFCEQGEKMTLRELAQLNDDKLRIVPCASVGNSTILQTYKAQSVHIKGIKIDFETADVYIALTDKKINGGDFGALIGPSVFENQTKETEADYV